MVFISEGFGTWGNGGQITPANEAVALPSLAVASSGNPTLVEAPRLLVDAVNNALSFQLTVDPYTANQPITLTGLGTPISYASLSPLNKAFFESLIGTTLVVTNQPNTFSSIPICQVPLPPAAWLFGSGLLGLIGVAKRKRVHSVLLS